MVLNGGASRRETSGFSPRFRDTISPSEDLHVFSVAGGISAAHETVSSCYVVAFVVVCYVFQQVACCTDFPIIPLVNDR